MKNVGAVPAEHRSWSRRRAPRAPSRKAWVIAERVAYEALVEARESDDAGLVEETRRAWAQARRRPVRAPRRRRS